MHFDRNGFAYVLDRADGTLLSAEKFVEHTNWAERIDLETGRPAGGPREAHPAGREHPGHLSFRDGRQEPAARVVLAPHQPDLRRHEQPVHELRGLRGALHRRCPVRRRERADSSPGRAATRASSWRGIRRRPRRSGGSPSRFPCGPARWSRPATWSSTGPWTAGSRRSTPGAATSCGARGCRRARSAIP